MTRAGHFWLISEQLSLKLARTPAWKILQRRLQPKPYPRSTTPGCGSWSSDADHPAIQKAKIPAGYHLGRGAFEPLEKLAGLPRPSALGSIIIAEICVQSVISVVHSSNVDFSRLENNGNGRKGREGRRRNRRARRIISSCQAISGTQPEEDWGRWIVPRPTVHTVTTTIDVLSLLP